MTILKNLEPFPYVPLAHLPTPIEPLANLSRHLGCAPIYVKRDDCTGLAMGGNKARQLEYYFGQAKQQNADTILITGAVQSNFVRMAAAAAAKCSMHCHIQLEERVGDTASEYRESGNVLLDRLLGAVIHRFPHGEDEIGADANLQKIAGQLKRAGARPYVIPLAPGHPPYGTLGYIRAAHEILSQIDMLGYSVDRLVVASGSGTTHAGLLFGLAALESPIRVTGICVRRNRHQQTERIMSRCREIAELIGVNNPVHPEQVEVLDDTLAPGYGQVNEATLEAIDLCARYEGLLLDPVYTGKAMAGCINIARDHDRHDALLFIHTGGTPGIFGYSKLLTDHLL
ncbi:MAG: D-cysteine desulfhydrase family protein [Gammaproteobacteria bacterium]